MKYLFDIGDAKEVVCDTEEPSLRLSFRILSADGITYYAYGKSRLVKDKGWLLLTIADNLVSSCFGDRKTQFVCAYKPLLAFCARHLKDGDIDRHCKFDEKVDLPPMSEADAILADCDVPVPPVSVADGEPFKVNHDDPRMKLYFRRRRFSNPFPEGTMEHFMYGKVLPHLAPHAAIPASKTSQKGTLTP